MSYQLLDDEREELEQLVFQLETSRIPRRRQAAELLLLRKLYHAVKDCTRLPPRAQAVLRRIPRLSDRLAWERLTDEEKAEARIEAIAEELRA